MLRTSNVNGADLKRLLVEDWRLHTQDARYIIMCIGKLLPHLENQHHAEPTENISLLCWLTS